MTVSFVLRLVPDPRGDLVGEIEAVLTGERSAVRSADDLVAQLRRALEGEAPDVVAPV